MWKGCVWKGGGGVEGCVCKRLDEESVDNVIKGVRERVDERLDWKV